MRKLFAYGSLMVSALLGEGLVASPTFSMEEQTVRIVKSKIPYVFDDQAPGPYNAVFDALMGDIDSVDVSHFWMPYSLSTRQLILGKADCRFLTGSNYHYFRDWGIEPENILFSDVVNSLKLRVYSPPGKPAAKDERALIGRLAVSDHTTLNSLKVTNTMPRGLSVVETETYERSFDMLDQGRVDYVLAYDFDAKTYFSDIGIEPYPSSETLILGEVKEALACLRSPATEVLIKEVNDRLNNLKASGKLQELLQQH